MDSVAKAQNEELTNNFVENFCMAHLQLNVKQFQVEEQTFIVSRFSFPLEVNY